MKRIVIRACITAGMAALVFWTALAVTGRHVNPAEAIAPAAAVICGLAWLRSARGDR